MRASTATPLSRPTPVMCTNTRIPVVHLEHLLWQVPEIAEDALRVGPQLSHACMTTVDASAGARDDVCVPLDVGVEHLQRAVEVSPVERVVGALHRVDPVAQSGWRTTGFLVAPTSSRRRTGVV